MDEAPALNDEVLLEPVTVRESMGMVLAVGAGLLVVVLAAGALFLGRAEDLEDEGRALLGETFVSVGTLPWGFAAVGATQFANKERLVHFADPELPLPEPPVIDPRKNKEWGAEGGRGMGGRGGRGRRGGGGGGPGGGGDGFDNEWVELEELDPAPPVEAMLVWYPLRKADDTLAKLFGGLSFKDIGRLGEDGEAVPVDSGHLDWSGFEAPFVRMRDYHKKDGEHTFHDTMRVNVSIKGKPCVLYLRWAERVPGARTDAEAFLAALEPRP